MTDIFIPFNEETALNAYCSGFFPMGSAKSDEVEWYRPDPRAIVPLDDSFHIPKSLMKILKKNDYTVKINTEFEAVIKHCSNIHKDGVWITDKIIEIYIKLHQMGFAHSLEIFKNSELAGGLYGVSINGAFFGESMFHLQSNCSKIALCELVFRLRNKNFILLDTQFSNPHLKQFNIKLIKDSDYMKTLRKALNLKTGFI